MQRRRQSDFTIGIALTAWIAFTSCTLAEYRFPMMWPNDTKAQFTYNRSCYATANPIFGHLKIARGLARSGYATGLWTWTSWIAMTPAARLARRVEIINDQAEFFAKGVLTLEGSSHGRVMRRLWREIYAPLEPGLGRQRFLAQIDEAKRNITDLCRVIKQLAYE